LTVTKGDHFYVKKPEEKQRTVKKVRKGDKIQNK